MVGVVLALAVWSFRHALGGRKVPQDGFLDGDFPVERFGPVK